MFRLALAFALLSSPALAQVASVAGTDGKNALGKIPCAANAGDPMQSCNAELRRHDDGSITVAVALGGGHVRNIYFKDGVPDSSNSTSKISHETRGDLMVVYIEPGEVFEIPKAALTSQ
ncbi:hypothetical protein D1823_09485 [Ruegeria sp. AD91A]|uniref:hypothetical protein n=1 Tax=Ruegeria sp. AD91A TaxID=2293862 RepID=UPI000E4E1345|nr:hypothetical protein [Ruegeria sp. AD91A]AXT28541.1 hypothetical protein D1823_09485 [Ruegeria sp. AD91A]